MLPIRRDNPVFVLAPTQEKSGWSFPAVESFTNNAFAQIRKNAGEFPKQISSLGQDTRTKLSIMGTVLSAAADKKPIETIYIYKMEDWPEAMNKFIDARSRESLIHLVGLDIAANVRNQGDLIWIDEQMKAGQFFVTDIFDSKNDYDFRLVGRSNQPYLLGLEISQGEKKTKLHGSDRITGLVGAIEKRMQLQNVPASISTPVAAPVAESVLVT